MNTSGPDDKEKVAAAPTAAAGKRRGLRVPVSFPVACELERGGVVRGRALNISTEGIFLQSASPMPLMEMVWLQFVLPTTKSAVRVAGEVVWSRSYQEAEPPIHACGVKFLDLEEPLVAFIRDYSLGRLREEEVIRSQGIVQVLADIRNLPSLERLKAYHALIDKPLSLNAGETADPQRQPGSKR